MVGSGGQVPQGLQGDVEGVVNEDQAKFERRRERAKARSSMKKKNVKGRDWVLKKKEVGSQLRCPFRGLTDSSITLSCIDNEGKRMFLGTRSTLLGSGRLASDLPVPLPVPPHINPPLCMLRHEQLEGSPSYKQFLGCPHRFLRLVPDESALEGGHAHSPAFLRLTIHHAFQFAPQCFQIYVLF